MKLKRKKKEYIYIKYITKQKWKTFLIYVGKKSVSYTCWEKVDIKSKKNEEGKFYWIYKRELQFKKSRGSPLDKANIQFTFKLV